MVVRTAPTSSERVRTTRETIPSVFSKIITLQSWSCSAFSLSLLFPEFFTFLFVHLLFLYFSFSFSYDTKIEHYRVIRKNNLVTVDDEEFFENLFKLVEVSCPLNFRFSAFGLFPTAGNFYLLQ